MNPDCWAKLYEKIYSWDFIAHPYGDAIQDPSHSILESNVQSADIENLWKQNIVRNDSGSLHSVCRDLSVGQLDCVKREF